MLETVFSVSFSRIEKIDTDFSLNFSFLAKNLVECSCGKGTTPSSSPHYFSPFRWTNEPILPLFSKRPRSTFHSVYDDKKVPRSAPLRNLVPGMASRGRGRGCVEKERKERETKELVRGAMISRCNRYDLSHGVVVAICAWVHGGRLMRSLGSA